MDDGPLDIGGVRAFVLTADLRSFTRAALALDTRQAAVSLKVQRLEARLGRRLLDRSPRQVRLSAAGAEFIEEARSLLAAHDRALAAFDGEPRQRLAVGLSEHVVGATSAALLRAASASDPRVTIEAHIGPSSQMIDLYERRILDAIIVRVGNDGSGEFLFEDQDGWFAAPDLALATDAPVPLIVLAAPCAMRASAAAALEGAGRTWREAFVGGGFAAVSAAVTAGLGVAPLARRLAPPGSVEIRAGLPELGRTAVVCASRASAPAAKAVFSVLKSALAAQGAHATAVV